MRLIKALSLAALAVVAAVAVIGPGSASTQEEDTHTEIVLCKTAEQLCKGERWPSGKVTLAESTHLTFLGPGTVLCNFLFAKGRITPEMAPALEMKDQNFTTKELKGCGGCTESLIESLDGKFTVAANDVYSALIAAKIKFVCAGKTCVYKTDAAAVIDEIATGKPKLLIIKQPLTFVAGDAAFCANGTWHGDIKLKGRSLLILFALFQLTQHEQSLQPSEAHQEELSKEEWHEEELHEAELE